MAMMDRFDITGYLEAQPTTTHVVSMWQIPNGCDYDKAYLINVFYDSEEEAKRFVDKWDAPPEMPILLTYAQHLEAQARAKEGEAAREECRRQMEEDYQAYVRAGLIAPEGVS